MPTTERRARRRITRNFGRRHNGRAHSHARSSLVVKVGDGRGNRQAARRPIGILRPRCRAVRHTNVARRWRRCVDVGCTVARLSRRSRFVNTTTEQHEITLRRLCYLSPYYKLTSRTVAFIWVHLSRRVALPLYDQSTSRFVRKPIVSEWVAMAEPYPNGTSWYGPRKRPNRYVRSSFNIYVLVISRRTVNHENLSLNQLHDILSDHRFGIRFQSTEACFDDVSKFSFFNIQVPVIPGSTVVDFE